MDLVQETHPPGDCVLREGGGGAVLSIHLELPMRVFVTGASGSIGSAVVPQLTAAGPEILGLVRSDASATAVAAAGGTPLRGDLTDLDSLRAGVAQADGVINLAFSNDWSNLEQGIDEEARAVQTLAAALAST